MTFAALSTLAAADAQATGPSTSAVLMGFVFVIIVLAILAGVTQIIGLFFRNQQPAAVAAPASAPVAPVASPTEAVVDAKLVALIAAAVHATLGAPHRIISIKGASSRGWASEGRRDISRSHKIR